MSMFLRSKGEIDKRNKKKEKAKKGKRKNEKARAADNRVPSFIFARGERAINYPEEIVMSRHFIPRYNKWLGTLFASLRRGATLKNLTLYRTRYNEFQQAGLRSAAFFSHSFALVCCLH